MVNVVGSTDDFDRWKPKNMRNHLTMTELCRVVNRDPSRIKQLEKRGVLPKPVRVKVGELSVRLYSPKEVQQIKQHFKLAKPGRPTDKKTRR